MVDQMDSVFELHVSSYKFRVLGKGKGRKSRTEGEGDGYTVAEGTELEVMKTLEQYVPYCKYKIYPVASESQVNELVKALSE